MQGRAWTVVVAAALLFPLTAGGGGAAKRLHDRNHIFSGTWSIRQASEKTPGSVNFKFVSDAAGSAALRGLTTDSSARCTEPSDWYVGTFRSAAGDSGPVAGCTSARVTPTAGTRFQFDGYFKSGGTGGVGELDLAVWCQPDGIGPIAGSFTAGGTRYPLIFKFLRHSAGDGSAGGRPCKDGGQAPTARKLELVAYPCGLPNGLPQPNLACAKQGFSVHLVGVLNKGEGSLPAGTVITIEQTRERAAFAAAPPRCTRPPRFSNCRLHFEASNKTGVFAPVLGNGVMSYRATLRMGGATGAILATSPTVRVSWSNQQDDPIAEGTLKLDIYQPCGAPRSIALGRHVLCTAGKQTAHMVATLVGFGGKNFDDLPDGIEIWIEQSPTSAFAITPPACASPPVRANCRVIRGFDPLTGGDVAYEGPTPITMAYRATVRASGVSLLTSNGVTAGWRR